MKLSTNRNSESPLGMLTAQLDIFLMIRLNFVLSLVLVCYKKNYFRCKGSTDW